LLTAICGLALRIFRSPQNVEYKAHVTMLAMSPWKL
jgi:hypothetical protein